VRRFRREETHILKKRRQATNETYFVSIMAVIAVIVFGIYTLVKEYYFGS
jgi:hypothetical protein